MRMITPECDAVEIVDSGADVWCLPYECWSEKHVSTEALLAIRRMYQGRDELSFNRETRSL